MPSLRRVASGGSADAVSFHTDGKCLLCIQSTVFTLRDERLHSNEAEAGKVSAAAFSGTFLNLTG